MSDLTTKEISCIWRDGCDRVGACQSAGCCQGLARNREQSSSKQACDNQTVGAVEKSDGHSPQVSGDARPERKVSRRLELGASSTHVNGLTGMTTPAGTAPAPAQGEQARQQASTPIRYEQVLRADGDPEMRPNERGTWMLYSEHKEIIADLQQFHDWAEPQLERLGRVTADEPFARQRPTLEQSNAWASAEEERDWWRDYALEIEGRASVPPSGPLKLDTDTQVFFYEQDHYYLSNFSAFMLQWNGHVYPTSEHAYHVMKFPDDPLKQTAIARASSAHDAFKMAERWKQYRRPDWDEIKVEVMRHILRAKVEQHEYVRRKLLETGDRELIENAWRDDYWGWGPNRDGRNMLGKLWMEIRTELRTASVTKFDLCPKCRKPLPPLSEWSMPACPVCVAQADAARCSCNDFPGADQFCTAHGVKFEQRELPADAKGVLYGRMRELQRRDTPERDKRSSLHLSSGDSRRPNVS